MADPAAMTSHDISNEAWRTYHYPDGSKLIDDWITQIASCPAP